MSQIALPAPAPLVEIERKRTLGAAIELCAELAGFELDKQLSVALQVDKAQFSRWLAGTEGITWAKLSRLMDACGNDTPVLWMLHQRGWDLSSLRRQESETERALRQAREELEQERLKVRVLTDALRGQSA